MPSPLPQVSVVVPCRHEGSNVGRLITELSVALRDVDWEILFVDDSDDETVAVLQELADADPRVRVLHRNPSEREGGLGGAVLLGFRSARSSRLLVMDADLQHPPAAVPHLLAPLLAGTADVVVGTRYSAGGSAEGLDGRYRAAVSRGCRQFTHVTFPGTRTTTDPLGGFFALDARILRNVELRPEGYKILLEILVRAPRVRVSDVPYTFAPRADGTSKSSLSEGRRFLRHVATLRLGRRPGSPGSATSRASREPSARVPLPRSTGGVSDEVARPVPAATTALRVLVLTSEAPPVISGISTTVAELRRGLTDLGHQVDVVSRDDFPRWVRREFRFSGFAGSWPAVRRHLRSFDVVNVHGPVPTLSDVFLLLAATLGGDRPAVVYTHHSDLNIPGLALPCAVYNRLTRRLAGFSDAVVVSSDAYREKIGIEGGAPVHVVPWGVSTDGKLVARTSARDDAPLRVLFVGQMRPYKGLHVLLDAVSGQSGLLLNVVGDGAMRPEIERRLATEGFTNVSLRGRLPDAELWAEYAANDVIVLPSTTTAEAYGLVLVEGMAAGCVPVASDLPGVREVASRSGLVVAPGDVDGLRAALLGLHHDRVDLARRSLLGESIGAGSARETAAAYERTLLTSTGTTAARHAARSLPPRWDDPARILPRLLEETGLSTASLVLLPAGRRGSALVWSARLDAHGRVATTGPRREASARVAGWVLSHRRAMTLGWGRTAPVAVRPHLLDARGGQTEGGSLLLPLGGRAVLCLRSSSPQEPSEVDLRRALEDVLSPHRTTPRVVDLRDVPAGRVPQLRAESISRVVLERDGV